MDDDAASVCDRRVRPRVHGSDGSAMDVDAEPPLNIENDLMTADGFGEAMDLVPSMLASRATIMFAEGDGKPRQSGADKLAAAPTPWLLKLAKEAVAELFKLRRDEVQQSWGEPLDQEEAVGYLVCDALGSELLPAEARTIGKKAIKLLKAAKTCSRAARPRGGQGQGRRPRSGRRRRTSSPRSSRRSTPISTQPAPRTGAKSSTSRCRRARLRPSRSRGRRAR